MSLDLYVKPIKIEKRLNMFTLNGKDSDILPKNFLSCWGKCLTILVIQYMFLKGKLKTISLLGLPCS